MIISVQMTTNITINIIHLPIIGNKHKIVDKKELLLHLYFQHLIKLMLHSFSLIMELIAHSFNRQLLILKSNLVSCINLSLKITLIHVQMLPVFLNKWINICLKIQLNLPSPEACLLLRSYFSQGVGHGWLASIVFKEKKSRRIW